MRNFKEFNKNGTGYALTWNEITTLLEQIGILYNDTDDNSALLTLILNFNSPYVPGLTIRMYFPFIVYDIYKDWHHDNKRERR
jgi:hypothetical protein